MSAEQIIRIAEDGTLSFGNYRLEEKAKAEDFAYQGDLLKVKTYHAITKLEKNGLFLYESVPGSDVSRFRETEEGMQFEVRAGGNCQLILGLAEQAAYEVKVDGNSIGVMETNLGGKLNVSIESDENKKVSLEVVRVNN